MAVDLDDLVDSLKREVNPPGSDLFPNASDEEWLGHLQDSFWEVKLDGITEFDGFTESDGVVDPTETGGDDLGRDMQQLIVIYAGIRIVRAEMRNIQTLFRSKAGPVEYEVQQSANVLSSIMTALAEKRNYILNRLSDLGAVDAAYVDMVYQRDYSMGVDNVWWVGA